MQKIKTMSKQIEKGRKVNSVKVTKVIEIEKDFNEIIQDKNRLESYINHLNNELIKAQEELDEINEILINIE